MTTRAGQDLHLHTRGQNVISSIPSEVNRPVSTERQNVPQTQSDTPASPPPSRHRGWSDDEGGRRRDADYPRRAGLYLFRIALIPLVIGSLMAYLLTPVVKWISADPHPARPGNGAHLPGAAVSCSAAASLVPWVSGRSPSCRARWSALRLPGDQRRHGRDSRLQSGRRGRQRGRGGDYRAGHVGCARLADTCVQRRRVLLLVIFTFLVAFYLTKDGAKFKAWFAGLVPPDYQEDVRLLIRGSMQSGRLSCAGSSFSCSS